MWNFYVEKKIVQHIINESDISDFSYMKAKKQIAIIIPYFGKWPDWINLYFYSCEQNKHIHWYFFTDCDIPIKFGNNLYFKFTTFTDYCNFVSTKLSIDFNPNNAYKLCDLKPFLGFLHKDIIEDYEFWGFGDVDIVFGDLVKYYPKKVLEGYNVLSNHADRISGHLSLFRNIDKYRSLSFRIKNWKSKLLLNEYTSLDELEFTNLIYPKSRFIKKIYSKLIRNLFNWRDAWVLYYHLMPAINWVLGTKRKRLYFKEQHTTPILGNDGRSFEHDSEEWLYKNGKIYNSKNNKEYIYLHFMIFKKNSFREGYYWKENYYNLPKNYDFSKGVIINTKGIFPIE